MAAEVVKEQTDGQKVIDKFPDRVPVYALPAAAEGADAVPKASKFLAPRILTVAQFMVILRNKLELDEKEALYVFWNSKALPSNSTLGDIYDTHKDERGFLNCTYAKENTFGGPVPSPRN